jgi:2-dehydro-3-deoxy-D-arabinonate dehydratase
MKLCRFSRAGAAPAVGILLADAVVDLGSAGIGSISDLLEEGNVLTRLAGLDQAKFPKHSLGSVTLLAPVEKQEVWAAGVTYLRSKKARMEESDFSASAYDRVYEAERPEIFFKSLPEKVVPLGEPVGIRADATWNVPEPELALVLTSKGEVAGFTIGNDMSSRDIEGENVLYLPQAKIYNRSCALGPCIRLADEAEARSWTISVKIERGGQSVFSGETSVSQIKRSFTELAGFLCRSQTFPHGAVLLTGTGVVPPDAFTLQPDDVVTIDISGIGTLANRVVTV